MLKWVVSDRWFALTDLILVLAGGILWTFVPEIGALPVIIVALFPWAVRIMAGVTPFKSTPQDWLIAIFLITIAVGFWAAYDREAAWMKVWFLILSVLLYYAIAAQPKENFEWVCYFLFCIGCGISIYFFLTNDFVALPRKVEFINRIGLWWMTVIPRLDWNPIHPNYVAGIAAVMTPFVLYPARELAKRRTLISTVILGITTLGCGLAILAILIATSRGVVMAIASAVSVWMMWRLVTLKGSRFGLRREAVFPSLVLILLFVVVLILYLGPANSGGVVLNNSNYGTGSRGELAARSLYLLFDFPFTGGGLGSFPGLYSHYMLGIPNFYVPNSHNLFLDVAIEQGIFGGLSFLAISFMSIWFMAKEIARSGSSQSSLIVWLTFLALFIAFVHGFVDDYFYNGAGSLLLLSLTGVSAMVRRAELPSEQLVNQFSPRLATFIFVGFVMTNMNGVRSAWMANLGAVQMAKVELAGFPANQWNDASILPALAPAEETFHDALQADSTNRTANHRLGLIAMLQGDFSSAVSYLVQAYQVAPGHRGVIKSFGYCYVWLGEMEKAQIFLESIPEAKSELDVYIWLWEVQGHPELAQKAFDFSNTLSH